ncbi:MAG: hypothetical protein H8D23_04730 [Candidatus Brocadiales bacterium]|nr:hypothetical protein [Candidatus Brocadiales bacterium]
MIKKILAGLALIASLAFAQDTAVLLHSQMYFNTQQDIRDILGEPVAIDTAYMVMSFGETRTIVYTYAMANQHEMIWLVFGRFGDWYPDYFFVEELNKEPVVVNITYFPLVPKLEDEMIEDYFK